MTKKEMLLKEYEELKEVTLNSLLLEIHMPTGEIETIVNPNVSDENSKMTAPYLYVESRFGRVPWKETNIELFNDNWEVIQ